MTDQQTQNTPTAPAPGSPEHDAAMAARFDTANTGGVETPPAATKAERPANVPEKFWDAEKGVVRHEELLASYTQLEQKLGTGDKKDDTNTQTPTYETTGKEGQTALQEVGLDYGKYEAEFAKNGKLSDASYAEMAAKNIPKSVVDAHIQTQVRLAQYEADALRTSVFEITGGEDKFTAMQQWAVANVPLAEREAFNRVIDSGDINSVKLAIQGLHAKYAATLGQEPNLLGGTGGKVAGDVFRSTAELTEAMRDPRYNKDPAYRADVEAKLSRSNIM